MPSRYAHLVDHTDMVLRADRAEIDYILGLWAAGQQAAVGRMTKALADLVGYLDDDGMDALIGLIGADLPAETVLLGAAAGLSSAEIKNVPHADDVHARLVTLAGLRGHHVG